MGFERLRPKDKTKEEIAEGGPPRVTTPSRAFEPVPEVEIDVADSGAQSGSISNSWLVILSMVN